MLKTNHWEGPRGYVTAQETVSGDRLAERMREAHERVCRVAVELAAEHFIWHTGEARALIETLPPLNEPMLESILGAIRSGARIPADCPLEAAGYLADILAASIRIRDFKSRRDHIVRYRELLYEYAQLNKIATHWQGDNREAFQAALAKFHEHVRNARAREAPALHFAMMADAPAIPDPLFRHGLPPGGFGLIIGTDGVGKGWLTLDLLLSCALARPVGIPAFQREGRPLNTLYLCYEDDPRVLRWRLDRICECAGIGTSDWRDAEDAGRIRVATDLNPLFVQDGQGAPQPTKIYDALAASLRAGRADLCIIDPLAAAAVLQSENDNSALNAVAVTLRDLARDTGCAILLTHHTSKAGRDDAGHHASRGGSALTGAARWVLRVLQGASTPGTLSVSVAKNSYGPGLRNVALHRLDQGVLHEVSGAFLGKQKEALVDAVVRFVNENPDININPNAVRRNCSDGARALITRLGVTPRAAAEAVEQALNQERVRLEERRRPNSRNKFRVLAPWQDDTDEVPF